MWGWWVGWMRAVWSRGEGRGGRGDNGRVAGRCVFFFFRGMSITFAVVEDEGRVRCLVTPLAVTPFLPSRSSQPPSSSLARAPTLISFVLFSSRVRTGSARLEGRPQGFWPPHAPLCVRVPFLIFCFFFFRCLPSDHRLTKSHSWTARRGSSGCPDCRWRAQTPLVCRQDGVITQKGGRRRRGRSHRRCHRA